MNSGNLEFLNGRLKYLGFGDNTLLNQQLEDHLVREEPEFELTTDAFFDHFIRIEAKLHFHRQDQQGIYVFDRYEAEIQYEQEPDRNKKRSFYIYKGIGVTFKEAYNLLDGRAAKVDMINRDDEKYTVWVTLNFEERDMHGNFKFKYYRYFDLEKVLDNYPIIEMGAPNTRKALLSALERGNRYLVTLETTKPEPKWIEANPGEKTIRIYAPGPPKRRREDRRSPAKRLSAASAEPAEEKTTGDQEVSEEPIGAPGK
ncbi:MAG TPA: hypothetical protein VGR89_06620, partial [Puia sp.]|nr:hypothetical protein [Puia sp.]